MIHLKKKKKQKQVETEKLYFGSQFKDTIHNRWKLMATSVWDNWSYRIHSQEAENWVLVLNFLFFYAFWNPSPQSGATHS